MKCFVVFSGKADLWWLRILKPGFRHCYLLINDGKVWMSLDAMSHHIEIKNHHHVPADFDMGAWLQARGMKVMEAVAVEPEKIALPVCWISCVEVIKRVLGIRNWWIWTPYQLYKHLLNQRFERNYQRLLHAGEAVQTP